MSSLSSMLPPLLNEEVKQEASWDEYPESYSALQGNALDPRTQTSSKDAHHHRSIIDNRSTSSRLPYPDSAGYSTPQHMTMHASPKLDLSGGSDPSVGFAGDHSLMMAANGNFAGPTNGTHSPSSDSSSRDSVDIIPVASVPAQQQPPQSMTSPAAPPPQQQQQPPMHLGMALHQAGLDPHFPSSFNGNDIFFQNNGLLPYPMLPFAASGRGMHNVRAL